MTKRIEYIDGLRALAVLAVVSSHVAKSVPFLSKYAYGRFTWHHGLLPALFSAAGAGIHGVDLFFVVSGFCLSYPTLARLHKGGPVNFDLSSFFAKRIVRIAPPYMICVAFTALFYVAATRLHTWMPASMASHVTFIDFIKQLFFFDRHTAFLNAVFWTLPIEARWYLIFPLALALWIVSPRGFWFASAALVVGYHFTLANSPDLGALPAFMAGIAAASFHVNGVKAQRVLVPLALAAFAAGLLLQTAQRSALTWQMAAFALVVLADEITWLRQALSLRMLTAVGAASYSIYLVHEQVGEYVLQLMYPRYGLGMGALSAAGAGIMAGFVFWFAAERPFVDGRIRGRMLAFVRPRVDELFALLRLKPGISLGGVANATVDLVGCPTWPESPSSPPSMTPTNRERFAVG